MSLYEVVSKPLDAFLGLRIGILSLTSPRFIESASSETGSGISLKYEVLVTQNGVENVSRNSSNFNEREEEKEGREKCRDL